MGITFNKMYAKIRTKEKDSAKNFLSNYYEIEKFKKVLVVDTLEEYACVINYYCNRIEDEKYIFRGVSKPNQKYSTLTRTIDKNSDNGDINFYINNHFNTEILYIREFEHVAGFLLQNYTMPIDLVAAAQHFGINTRLVDWTSSPLIATLFSLNGTLDDNLDCNVEGNKYYLVLAVDKNKHIRIHNLTTEIEDKDNIDIYSNRYVIYEKMLLSLMEIYKNRANDKDKIEKYFKNILAQTHTQYVFVDNNDYEASYNKKGKIQDICNRMVEKFKNNAIVFVETNFTNERIVNQRGLFQIAVDPSRKYMDNIFANIDIIMISEKIKDNIIDYCKRLGVNYYGLMPDLEAIAKRINNKFKKGEKTK